MGISRNLDTQGNRDFWDFVDKTAKEVSTWPPWKRGVMAAGSMSEESGMPFPEPLIGPGDVENGKTNLPTTCQEERPVDPLADDYRECALHELTQIREAVMSLASNQDKLTRAIDCLRETLSGFGVQRDGEHTIGLNTLGSNTLGSNSRSNTLGNTPRKDLLGSNSLNLSPYIHPLEEVRGVGEEGTFLGVQKVVTSPGGENQSFVDAKQGGLPEAWLSCVGANQESVPSLDAIKEKVLQGDPHALDAILKEFCALKAAVREGKPKVVKPKITAFKQETRDLVNELMDAWPTIRDGKRIPNDAVLAAGRIEKILADHQEINAELLKEAAFAYLSTKPAFPNAIQFWFGPGKPGQISPWETEVRGLLTKLENTKE